MTKCAVTYTAITDIITVTTTNPPFIAKRPACYAGRLLLYRFDFNYVGVAGFAVGITAGDDDLVALFQS